MMMGFDGIFFRWNQNVQKKSVKLRDDVIWRDFENFLVPMWLSWHLQSWKVLLSILEFVFDPEGHIEDESLRLPTLFAHGLRACLKMRFALTILRIASVHILYHYKIESNAKTTRFRSTKFCWSFILSNDTKNNWRLFWSISNSVSIRILCILARLVFAIRYARSKNCYGFCCKEF